MYSIRKEKQNDMWSNANFNWRNKNSGKCHKSTTDNKNSTTISVTVQLCTNELKSEFREIIAATLKHSKE